jgi:porphobilinogen synthase
MPGCYQLSLDQLLQEVMEGTDLGIPGVLLFRLPAHKDDTGSEAYDDQGIIQEAVRVIKQAAPQLMVITDVCLCEYTDHGHCGVLKGDQVDNNETLSLLAHTAVSHVEAGADW